MDIELNTDKSDGANNNADTELDMNGLIGTNNNADTEDNAGDISEAIN